ncbi:hypothetical protein FACS189490_09780 [Clostridia bacterium]|nr:hypothetical protein FACS189490_09780 [Clostridia bacterium]
MEILRAELSYTDLFTVEQLSNGACCFYTEDKLFKYYFAINGETAVLVTNDAEKLFVDDAIGEFLWYSGFVSAVLDESGGVIQSKSPVDLRPFGIAAIQPSQFYINELKLTNCKKWIKSASDVKIPVAEICGATVALDGHTRLFAALDLGFSHIYVYEEEPPEHIEAFVAEARKRGIGSVSDMELLSAEEYIVKWHKYCDDFFNSET